jgi:hypothetical protein
MEAIMLRRLVHECLTLPGRATRLVADLRKGRRIHGAGRLAFLRRLVYLRYHGGFRPREALEEGLLDVRIPRSILAATMAKKTLVELQARVNPIQLDCLTADNGVFYAYCGPLGLPIPRLFGVAARPAGYAADGRPLREAADWRDFVDRLPDEFIVKPSQGAYGRGVELFRREHGGFVGSTSGAHSADAVSSAFFTDARYRSFVIQECLHAHPALQVLSGTACLQTARMWTDVDDQGSCRIVFAVFRVITGHHVIDNFASGNTGNLLCCVDRRHGTLDFGIGVGPGGIGWSKVTHHPRTGIDFQDFHLPDWEEACALVKRAALLFLPMHNIGWDVAFTDRGPVIIEANKRFDPANEVVVYVDKPHIYEDIADLYVRLRKAPRR